MGLSGTEGSWRTYPWSDSDGVTSPSPLLQVTPVVMTVGVTVGVWPPARWDPASLKQAGKAVKFKELS